MMPHAQRKELQRCAVHPKVDSTPRFIPGRGGFFSEPQPQFRPDQGKFITDHFSGTRFFCFGCLNLRKKSQTQGRVIKKTRAQNTIASDFSRAGIKFKSEYRIDKWPFDLGFPELRLLIEIDDNTHTTERGGRRDFYKDKFAEELGWTVKRVPGGAGATARCLAAYAEHRKATGS